MHNIEIIGTEGISIKNLNADSLISNTSGNNSIRKLRRKRHDSIDGGKGKRATHDNWRRCGRWYYQSARCLTRITITGAAGVYTFSHTITETEATTGGLAEKIHRQNLLGKSFRRGRRHYCKSRRKCPRDFDTRKKYVVVLSRRQFQVLRQLWTTRMGLQIIFRK